MKIAIIGAAGRSGSRIVAEALRRGHDVTALGRHPEKITPLPKLTIKQADANDTAGLAALLAGNDAVIVAIKHAAVDRLAFMDGIKKSGVKRILVCGGASSLFVSPGVRLMDSPGYSGNAERTATRDFAERLRDETDLQWTALCPSASGPNFAPGPRTGKYRVGKDDMLVDPETGKSWLSVEDFAVALIDELETPRHTGERFTVGH